MNFMLILGFLFPIIMGIITSKKNKNSQNPNQPPNMNFNGFWGQQNPNQQINNQQKLTPEQQMQLKQQIQARMIQNGVNITQINEKQKIKERLEKGPDPHYMPQQAKEFTQEDIEHYHDIMDTCDGDGCDVGDNSEQNQQEQNVQVISTNQPISNQNLDEDTLLRRNAIIQMMVADSILNRKSYNPYRRQKY